MESFYVTLYSNNNSKFYENSLSKFKTKLAKRIRLEGNWEIGLSSISFTNSWINLPEKEYIKFWYFDKKGKEFTEKASISKNHYPDIASFIAKINASIRKVENVLKSKDASITLPSFVLDTTYNFVYSQLSEHNNFLVFPEISVHLSRLLGFNYGQFDERRNEIYKLYKDEMKKDANYIPVHETKAKNVMAKRTFELFGEFHSLFVFSSLVKDSCIGENLSPLLRYVEVPTKANFGEQVVKTYSNIIYIDLRTKDFECIDIEINDENNKPFPFQHGRVIIVLHFRKKQ